jgi:phenylpropionate dioxygenase-like ring-hydroxylating dioxygenase large terminal subunit
MQLFDLKQGVIRGEVYADEFLYQLELERIFKRSWLFLCHESQVPRPGDFVTGYMAEDPIVAVRQRDGSITAFLNQCRHRGMKICRADMGRAKAFKCSYHGWVYDINGRLVNVPFEKEAYDTQLDKSRWGLRRVPRIESYRGLYFGNWDVTAPSLYDYLGASRWFLDIMFGRNEAGVEALPGIYRWQIDANWKIFAEQHCWDMYHVQATHLSGDIAFEQLERHSNGVQYSDPRMGHGSGFYLGKLPLRLAQEKEQERTDPPHVREWRKRMVREAEEELGEPRASLLQAGHMEVFPNLAGLNGPGNLRILHPRGPNKLELWSLAFVAKDTPREVREERAMYQSQMFSPSGLIEQDDSENLIEIQSVLSGAMARESEFCMQMGLGKSEAEPDMPGGTKSYVFSEEAGRNYYRTWLNFMTGASWEEMGFAQSAAQ